MPSRIMVNVFKVIQEGPIVVKQLIIKEFIVTDLQGQVGTQTVWFSSNRLLSVCVV